MPDAVIMLAKNFDIKKVSYPCYVSEKLDGVAADFYNNGNRVHVRSRQDKPLYSVDHIVQELQKVLQPLQHVVGELYIPGQDFKDIGGLVRGYDPAPSLELHVYDFYHESEATLPYEMRMLDCHINVMEQLRRRGVTCIKLIPTTICDNETELLLWIKPFHAKHPDAEGFVVRSGVGKHSTYMQGKRSWGLMRKKTQETADLRVIGFEEAIAEDGIPKGMIGRVWVHTIPDEMPVGVGAGCMTHAERTEVFNNQQDYIGKIAEIKYMPDASYAGGMREARFLRWRDDKTEPNME